MFNFINLNINIHNLYKKEVNDISFAELNLNSMRDNNILKKHRIFSI